MSADKYSEALRLLKEAHHLAGKSMGDAWYSAASVLLFAPQSAGVASKPRCSYEPLAEERIEEMRTEIKGATTNLWIESSVRERWHGELDRLCHMAVSALLYAVEIQRLRDTPQSATMAWVEAEKGKADAYEAAARICEEMSYPPEGQERWHGTDNEWAAIKLEDAAKAIRERKAKVCHVTQAASGHGGANG